MADLIQKKRHLSSFQSIILGFAALILIGALLLMLPIASKSRTFTQLKIIAFFHSPFCFGRGMVIFALFCFGRGINDVCLTASDVTCGSDVACSFRRVLFSVPFFTTRKKRGRFWLVYSKNRLF